MLPKKRRLSRSQFAVGKRTVVRTPYFILKTSPNNLPYSRIGIVVSGAAIKSAVKRNFLRRQTKATFQGVSMRSIDFVIIFNRSAKSLTKMNLQAELRKVLK